ncbi:hypothetical protein FRB99_001583 [Tulasnella sp. 403]|nr:hypothetical protein FRB99_001583 [Tulasnella sp. 403]
MKSGAVLDRIDSSIDAESFFAKYVATRTPVVLQGSLDDPSYNVQKWTNLRYLATKAGSATVMVEPIHRPSNQFGTGERRIRTIFAEFLRSLKATTGPYNYMTTQYEDSEEAEAETRMFPSPTHRLTSDFPPVPRLMGNLVLEQVNLWIGRSEDGASSGLHHDFHDNLYCLLQGHKRFILYPPQAASHLHPHGKLDKVHPNGLISYQHYPIRSDGLTQIDAAECRVKALKRKLSARRAAGKDCRLLEREYGRAVIALRRLEALEPGNSDDESDADAILARLEAVEKRDRRLRIADESEGNGIVDEEEWGGIVDSKGGEDGEPSSFSRIPTAYLHDFLQIPTTAKSPSFGAGHSYAGLKKAGKPLIVDISAGDILYLPASWWHEVTSSGPGATPHMAFNYWFHPPNDLNDFSLPYRDKIVWECMKNEAKRTFSKLNTKSEEEPSRQWKKRKSLK